MDLKTKADSLASKMNDLTDKFDLSEELTTTGSEIEEYIEEKTQEIELYKENVPQVEVINLEIMVDDFKFVRDTLRETTENGRRVLNILTADLLDKDVDDEKRAEYITSFSEMNTAVCNNMKLYIAGYKEISIALLNIDKYKKQSTDSSSSDDKAKTINNTFNISTADLIKSLKDESIKTN